MKRFQIFLPVFFLIAVAVGFSLMVEPDVSVDDLKARYAQPPSQFVTLAGMDVHYRDEGAGPVVLLLHGTSSSLHTWDGWTAALRDTFRVVRMDLPAFGLTGPHPEADYRVAAYVDFVVAFMDALDLETVHLAGNSLGGAIAWQLALDYPNRVERLILVDPAGYPSTEAPPLVFRLARIPLIDRMIPRLDTRYFIQKSLLDVYADDGKVTDALIDRYHDLSLREGNRAAFVARVRTVNANRFEDIRRLMTPTLVMWGEEDTWTYFSEAEAFMERLPNATLITYPDVGHVPMEEIPEESADDARRFLLGGQGDGQSIAY